MQATVLRIFLLIATGITLVCAQVCQTNADCQNGGICVTDPDGNSVNRCDCTSSYTGNVCEIDCGVLCYNDAECLVDIQEHVEMGFGDSEFSCKCKDGWQGFLCSIRVETCPDGLECLNGGDCIEIGNGSYRCDCPVGYDGQNCTALIEETTNPPSIATSSNEDSTGCSVCGFGLYVSKPEAIFAYPEQPEATCGMLQEAGLNGVIPLDKVRIEFPPGGRRVFREHAQSEARTGYELAILHTSEDDSHMRQQLWVSLALIRGAGH